MVSLGQYLSKSKRTHISPVAWRTEDGMFFGHDGSCWLYNILPLKPLFWEDHKARMAHAAMLHDMFIELGSLSRGGAVPGTKLGSVYRHFHLVSLCWDDYPRPPEDTSPEVAEWLLPVFSRFSVTKSLFAIGVKLRPASPITVTGFMGTIKGMINRTTDHAPDRKLYRVDRARVGQILARAQGRPPTDEEARRLESWWNGGRGSNAAMVEEADGASISVDAWPEGLEMSALLGFRDDRLNPEDGLWLADAFGHEDGCVAVSFRGHLVPAAVVRNDFRKAQRKGLRRSKEEAEVGDLQREEDARLYETANMLESLYVGSQEPLVRGCSAVFARRAQSSNENFATMLATHWGLDVNVLLYRQFDALEETLPLGKGRLGIKGPYSHDLTVGVLAASGIGSHNKIGDDSGVWMGTTPPDGSLVWLDPMGSSKFNKPPCMGVVGEPGAGKTFFLQLIATQASLAGHAVVFINPKSADSLIDFAEAIGGDVIKVSAAGGTPGLLDPFRYTDPEIAADIALNQISTVLTSLSDEQLVHLANGLRENAMMGARCVGDALDHPDIEPGLAKLIKMQANSIPLFGLGVALEAPAEQEAFAQKGKLTLIEFDRPIPIPQHFSHTSAFNMDERCAVAAIRLICRIALEQMLAKDTAGGPARGGVLIVDEAHVFLSSQEGRSILQGLGRTGRSQGILPIMATQLLADLVAEGVDMDSYMGRTFVMKMEAPREMEAALQLCRLEDNEIRRAFLEHAGPVHGNPDPRRNHGALGYYRDLNGDVSVVQVGPIPEEIRMRFSTNLADRQKKQELELAKTGR